jgi:hypothetical protein
MIEKPYVHGFLAAVDVMPPLVVKFQYNPDSVIDNKEVKYAEGKASLSDDAPGKVYTGGGHRTISFTLQLHGLEQGTNLLNPLPDDNGISTELAKLRSFLYPKKDAWGTLGVSEGKALSSPPTCIFGYGAKILECIVTDLAITEKQFNSALAPVRAEVKVTLTVIEAEENRLHKADRAHRNALAALGSVDFKLF